MNSKEIDKSKLIYNPGLRRYIVILVMAIVSTVISETFAVNDNLDYNYIAYKDNGGFDKWTGNISTGLISPELDLTSVDYPTVFKSESKYISIYVSSDGKHFIEAFNNVIPKNTRYIMLTGETLPELLAIYDGDENFYTEDVKFELSDTGIENYILMKQLPTGEYSGRGKVTLLSDYKGFKILEVPSKYECQIFIEGERIEEISYEHTNRCYILPKDTQNFEINVISKSAGNIRKDYLKIVRYGIPYGTAKLTTDQNDYFDWDGDGKLECYDSDNRSFIKFDIANDSFSQTKVIPSPILFSSVYGIDSEGYVHAEYSKHVVDANGFNPKDYNLLLKSKNFCKEVDVANEFRKSGYNTHLPADVSLNGNMDYFFKDYDYVSPKCVTVHSGGSSLLTQLNCMTPGEYADKRSELIVYDEKQGIPGMADMIIRPGQTKNGLFDTSTFIDINSDGLFDIIDEDYGKYFVNAGDGDIVEYTFSGYICVRDVTGDGINDIICWDNDNKSLDLLINGDPSTPVSLIQKVAALENLTCRLFVRDVDADADLDIVLVSYSHYESRPSYIIIFENLGSCKFRKREHNIGAIDGFISLCDYDSDGKYELLFDSSYSKPVLMRKIERCDKIGEPVEIGKKDCGAFVLKSNHAEGWSIVNDINNTYTVAKKFNAGSRPDKPAPPTLLYDEATGRLSVSWARGHDNETPVLDLTYELRIGTTPGNCDIMAAQALSDGTRRNLRHGREGYSTHRTFDTSTWPEGNIYISYQVIDDGFYGSEFSEPAVFVKSGSASGFQVNCNGSVAQSVPVELIPLFTPQQGVKYTWDITDGEIIKRDEVSQALTIVFNTPGKKNVKLSSENAAGVKSVSTKTIDVIPVDISIDSDKPSYSFVIDLDSDGYHEPDGKYKENAEGGYDRINKTFVEEDVREIADVNGDGLADLFYYNTFLLNYGDGDMDKEMRQPLKNYDWKYDLDNDGKLDDAYNIKYNNGNYTSVEDTEWRPVPGFYQYGFNGPQLVFFDFNGDGLLDIGSMGASSTNPLEAEITTFYIYENIDGRSFKEGQAIPGITQMPALVDDIDGDGKADYLFTNAGFNYFQSYDAGIRIKWGSDAPDTVIECPDADPFASLDGVFDYNNDGMKDLCVGLRNSKRIVYIYPDKSYSFVKYSNDTRYGVLNNPGVMHNNKLSFGAGAILQPFVNERPLPPTQLRAVQNAGAVVVEWNPGSDKETPSGGLRYNVSVKRKGAEGDGAYLISPLNGGSEICALPAPYYLPTAPKFTIPIRSIPSGEYEIRIQSVDYQNVTSAFSETLNFMVKPSATIDIPTSAMVGKEVEIRILTNEPEIMIDFGEDSKIVDRTENTHTVIWNSVGLKHVKLGSDTIAGIMIHPTIDASFVMPDKIGDGDLVVLKGNNMNKGTWSVLSDGGHFDPQSQRMKVEYASSDTLRIRVTGAERFTLRHYIKEDYGEADYDASAEVEPREVAIELVTTHNDNYKLTWNPDKAPKECTGVIVLKETSRYNDYKIIDKVPVEAGYYIDTESNSRIKTERYKIAYMMPYGETKHSEAHKPLHVQINVGANSAINLAWNKYEGITVDSYVIFKGKSSDALEEYQTISGSNTSFSDDADNAQSSYYAIAIVRRPVKKLSRRADSSNPNNGPFSNVVSGAEARNIILAEKIFVSVVNGGNQFDGKKSVALQARMIPTNATINKVRWELAPENSCMIVDEYGNVTACSIGKGKVRAYSVDGSDVYGEIELDNNVVPVESLQLVYSVDKMYAGSEQQFAVKKNPVNANEKIVWTSTRPNVATVDENGVVTAGLTETVMRDGYIVAKQTQDYTIIHVGTERTGSLVDKMVNVEIVPLGVFEVIDRPVNNQLRIGDQFQYKVKYHPENATFKPHWRLGEGQDGLIATITPEGFVTALNPGFAQFVIYSPDNIQNGKTIFLEVLSDSSSLESIILDDDAMYDVYDLLGKKILNQGTRKDIEHLTPGFYIINGKKYLKK